MIDWGVHVGGERFNILEIVSAAAALEGQIRSLGVAKIKLHDDQRSFADAVGGSLKGFVGEHFRSSINTLVPTRFLGFSGHDANGKTLVTAAMRCDDLGGWSLDRYVSEYWERAYRGEDGEPVALETGSLDFARDIRGNVAYIGEGYVDESCRDNNLAAYVVRLCIVLSQLKWSPDYIYGWMANKHAYRGLFLRWGYTTCYPNGMKWVNAPSNPDYGNLCFLGCDESGVAQLLRAPLAVMGETNQMSMSTGT